MQRIALVTSQFDRVRSGPGTFANYLFADEGCSADLTFLSEDIDTPTTCKRRIACPAWVGRVPGTIFFKAVIYHRAFLAAHREHAFDLVWYNTSPISGFLSAQQRVGVPVVLMINDSNYIISRVPFASRATLGLKRSLTYSVKRPLEKRALQYCDAVVVNSRFMKRQVEQQYGVASEKLHVLYKAADVSRFAFQSSRLISEPVRVLFMKTDYVRGGLSDLVEALSTLPFRTQLTIAGPPLDHTSTIKAIIRRHRYRGRVEHCGRVAREHVPSLFREHDLLCVPSRAEALGVVFLEALAAGMPAVGSSAGGIPEVLDEGRAGWLAEPGNVPDLRRSLITAVKNEKQRLQKVQHGHVFVADNFSTEVMVRRFEKIASDIVRKKRNA